MRKITAALVLSMLVVAGYVWNKAELGAIDRAEWLAEPIPSDDDTVGIALSAGGFLNRDIRVSVFVLGEEDRAAEDLWLEASAHGDYAEQFYRRGFRRIIVSNSGISRDISETARMGSAPEESGKSTARPIG